MKKKTYNEEKFLKKLKKVFFHTFFSDNFKAVELQFFVENHSVHCVFQIFLLCDFETKMDWRK